VKALRAGLAAIGVAALGALLLVEGSRWLWPLFGYPPHAWDAAPDSLRFQVYDAIFVRHRWLTVLAFVAYGAAAVAAYRKEILAGLGGPARAAVAGLLALAALTAALLAWLYG
jgi:hypothetical protein